MTKYKKSAVRHAFVFVALSIFTFTLYAQKTEKSSYESTKEKIEDAIAQGAFTRQMSMIIQGSQMNLEEFKKEFYQMMDYASKHTKQLS